MRELLHPCVARRLNVWEYEMLHFSRVGHDPSGVQVVISHSAFQGHQFDLLNVSCRLLVFVGMVVAKQEHGPVRHAPTELPLLAGA